MASDVSQRAREAVKTFQDRHVVAYLLNTRLEGDWQAALAEAFDAFAADATALERERCAVVAQAGMVEMSKPVDPTDVSYNMACEHIFAAIRKGPTP